MCYSSGKKRVIVSIRKKVYLTHKLQVYFKVGHRPGTKRVGKIVSVCNCESSTPT